MFSRLDSRNTTSNEPSASNYKSDIEISKYKRESKRRYGNKKVLSRPGVNVRRKLSLPTCQNAYLIYSFTLKGT
jgi:hypothetical protein